jgi:hypothetical protein
MRQGEGGEDTPSRSPALSDAVQHSHGSQKYFVRDRGFLASCTNYGIFFSACFRESDRSFQ